MNFRMVLASVAFAGLAGFILIVSGGRVENKHDVLSRRIKYLSGYKKRVAYLKADDSNGISKDEIQNLRRNLVETERDLCTKLMKNPGKHDPEAVSECAPFQAELAAQTHPAL